MARKQTFSLKNTAKFSMVSTLVLGAVMVISSQVNHTAILGPSALAYVLVSLVFSISAFLLLLRHYKITSENYILMRVIAIVGAVICFGIWAVLIYPMVMLMP